MAKKIKPASDAAPAAAAGTATGTGTGTKSKTAVKPEVKVHVGLAELIKKFDAAAEKAGSYMIEMCEYVAKENISNPTLIKTIIETRGVTESTAKSQASRIRGLLKDTDQFEAIKRGDVTLRAGVKSAQTKRAASSVTKQKAFDNKLVQFVTAAKATGQDRKTILATVDAALDKAGVK